MVVTAAAAAATALAAVLLVAAPALERRALAEARSRLAAEARLVARVLEAELARGTAAEALDPIIDATARDVAARITVIAPDGRVLADSVASGAELGAMESHSRRPEVMAALATGYGAALRPSATVRAPLLYAAVRVDYDGRAAAVARVALPLDAIEAQGRELWRAAALAVLAAVLATALASLLLSSSLARSLRAIMETARELAKGNLAARIRVGREDELGELARILNVSADEQQARLAETARDRGRMEAILAAMGDGVLAVDHEGRVVLANQALVQGLGLREPLGRHYLEVVRQREVGVVIEEVLGTGGRRTEEVELIYPRRVYAIAGGPFPGAEGTPPGAVLTFHDATERRRLERVRRDFVANASHELRTPLTSIRGFVEALEDGALQEPETGPRFLGKIRTHADRMAALLEDLLELSRLESGARPPQRDEVVPAEVVDDVVASFTAPAARKRIALHKTDRGAPAVLTDPERLRRILENLVDNAVKYTPEGGEVEVLSAPGPDGAAVVEVRDDGPGIAAEHLPRLFERFYRVDKARSRELGGTGLGLAIVKHLAEGMGAFVSVESQPGRGTRFTVSLPSGR
jgi:two-component system phosphate regulon sensor histidine kinase PhoR